MKKHWFLVLSLVLFPVAAFAGWVDNEASVKSVFEIAAQVCLVASLVANVTPTETDNKVIGWIQKIINLAAGNWWMVFKKKG